jgi:hypothetical protein
LNPSPRNSCSKSKWFCRVPSEHWRVGRKSSRPIIERQIAHLIDDQNFRRQINAHTPIQPAFPIGAPQIAYQIVAAAIACRAFPGTERGLGNIVSGDFTAVLAKHSKSFSLVDTISVGVDRMQRNFEPIRKQVEAWRQTELSDVAAKMIIYEAFIEGELEVPKHLARRVHDYYFDPKHDEFRSRTSPPRSNSILATSW